MIWPFRRHKHDFRHHVSTVPMGATLGWGGIEPCYAITYRCECGSTKTKRGMILPLIDVRRDVDGWPLADDGSRMKVAKL